MLPPDPELLLALQRGDEAVFTALIDAWAGSMLRLARVHVSTRDSAEEIVQETWLAVLKGIDRFRGESSLRTWVYRILVNQAKTRGVREGRILPFASLEGEEGPTVDPDRFRGPDDAYPRHWESPPEPWPEDTALRREVRTVVDRAVAQLPARQRLVITLRDIEDRSADEVCDLLELSPGNQRVLLHRARAAVRAQVEGYVHGVER